MRSNRHALAICMLLGVAAASGCSGGKKIGRADAQSELRLAASLSAESRLFIDYMRAERSTRPYMERHLEYLEQTVQQHISKLEKAPPEPDAAAGVQKCLTELRQLQGQLDSIREQTKGADRRS